MGSRVFFAGIFAETLQRAAALAIAVFRFVIKLIPRAREITLHGIVSGNFSNHATRISYRNDIHRDVFNYYAAGTNVIVFYLKAISDRRNLRYTKTINNTGAICSSKKFPFKEGFVSASYSAPETVQMYDFYPTVSADRGQ
ncbi:hypothetical protein ACPCIT_06500 [Pseudomonas siliginis]|uniref:hypothetical protein n=1 Tax=Pseudomonas siliginis TaxID=2842346 RepID=UPI003C2B19A5